MLTRLAARLSGFLLDFVGAFLSLLSAFIGGFLRPALYLVGALFCGLCGCVAGILARLFGILARVFDVVLGGLSRQTGGYGAYQKKSK
jgi:hypothetical protein